MSVLFSQFAPFSPSPTFLCQQVCSLLGSSVYYFSRFHIYVCVWIYNTWFFSFWLTSLYIRNSRFIHLSTTDSNSFLFYGWVIFHCLNVPQLHYPFICWWTSRLLPCPGYWRCCCSDHWVYVSFWIVVFLGYMPSTGTAGSYGRFILRF